MAMRSGIVFLSQGKPLSEIKQNKGKTMKYILIETYQGGSSNTASFDKLNEATYWFDRKSGGSNKLELFNEDKLVKTNQTRVLP